jgi:hypothetical protein
MTRPTSHADLTEYALKGHVVATIPATFITRFPSLGQHLLAALAEAQRLGLTIDGDDIVIDKTEAELDSAVKSAQTSWDYDLKFYERWIAGTLADDSMRSYYESSARRFAKAEGLPVLDEVTA